MLIQLTFCLKISHHLYHWCSSPNGSNSEGTGGAGPVYLLVSLLSMPRWHRRWNAGDPAKVTLCAPCCCYCHLSCNSGSNSSNFFLILGATVPVVLWNPPTRAAQGAAARTGRSSARDSTAWTPMILTNSGTIFYKFPICWNTFNASKMHMNMT